MVGRSPLARAAGGVLTVLVGVFATACHAPLTTAPPPRSPPAAPAEPASATARVDAPLPIPTPVPLPEWAATCPVTRLGGLPVPLDVREVASQIFGAGPGGARLYGQPNGSLWVAGLPERGLIGFTPQLGEESWKLGWWRRQEGQLRIDGRRLDADAPPLRSHVPDGYGPKGFQASGVIFPTEGCWEIVGHLGDEELRFVMLVVASRS